MDHLSVGGKAGPHRCPSIPACMSKLGHQTVGLMPEEGVIQSVCECPGAQWFS